VKTDKNSTLAQENLVNIAFNAQSQKFDQITTSNPMEVLFRDIVRKHVTQFVRKDQFMLELNCGTGLDAVYFAELGLQVHATDNSDGMLAQLAEKTKRFSFSDRVSYQKCSFNNLEMIESNQKFDHVFSNFGGLNCAENIKETIKQLDAHVNHKGSVHFVMIAPICLWEIAAVFKGRFVYAFRRFSKRGVKSKVEGHYFQVLKSSLEMTMKFYS
jgi:ubiquinone/menaquinone biosynthesis C-methylase UbiE